MGNYQYPRVDITTNVRSRYRAPENPKDTTNLFVPFVSPKGPANEVVRIHTLSQFIDVFGELSYEQDGVTALNIYNWLSNGGTVYAYRIVGEKTKVAKDETAGISAKYPGKFYEELTISVARKLNTKDNTISDSYTLLINSGKTSLERYPNLSVAKLEKALRSSSYIAVETESKFESFLTNVPKDTSNLDLQISLTAEGSEDEALLAETATDSLLYTFWNVTAASVLANPLATPVELILDAGYPAAIKEKMAEFITTNASVRDDIIAIFDQYELQGKLVAPKAATLDETKFVSKNIAVYAQYFTIEDAILTDQDIYVTPTYFLSKLLAYNDTNYGRQFPTAGLTRGVLDEAKAISENPTPSDKESFFLSRVNYAEKTPREISFQCQRTHDGSGTDAQAFDALSFLNNARYLSYMKHELTRVGREYLFEFNDSITLSNMSAVLNKLVNEWVSNRTLSEGSVTVERSATSDETVEVTLTVRFTGTIEVISVTIAIE